MMFKEQDPTNFGVTPEMIEQAMDATFEEALNETFGEQRGMEGSVVKGMITAVDGETATVDIGMKSEARIALREFGENTDIKIGDMVDVYIDSLDSRYGEVVLSREKARREEALDVLEKAFQDKEKVKGVIFGRVKGGFTVDLNGVLAFMPGSQMDVRPIKDVTPLMNVEQDMMILKMDRPRNNLIVSRRAIMDESRSENRDALMAGMKEGMEVEGVVKNITEYGAFVDLGGVDGLLHITDMAWHRISHPSELISLGETIKVQVIRYNKETGRVSLGMKQLQEDPWKVVAENYQIGSKVKGKVTNITEYGAFVELESGVEGLIHVSEMSWTRKNVHPGKILSTSQEVEVMVLEIDGDKRRISLGYKQCQDNPWGSYATTHPVGSVVEGQVRSVTDFGIFIGLNEEIDGLVHMSDISWDKSSEAALAEYKKGDTVTAKVLAVDPDKERISLGIKQMEKDPSEGAAEAYAKGSIAKGTVEAVDDKGITVALEDGLKGYIKKVDVAVDRAAQDTSSFKEGDEVSAQVVRLGKKEPQVSLSIKAMELAEEKEAVKAYASSNGGSATLGDALGDALKKAKSEK